VPKIQKESYELGGTVTSYELKDKGKVLKDYLEEGRQFFRSRPGSGNNPVDPVG
jgi:hypothetical protein